MDKFCPYIKNEYICGVGKILRKWREEHRYSKTLLSQKIGIDASLLSKYEKGKRMPSQNHLLKISQELGIPMEELRKEYLAEKIADLLRYEINASDILKAAESRVEYLSSKNALVVTELSEKVKDRLKEVDKLQQKWASRGILDSVQLQKMNEYFENNYTYESNRIEGNTLTFQETHLVVSEGLTIGGKSMTEHLEAINHKEAIDWLKTMISGEEDLNRRNVLDIHRLILKSIDSTNAGSYRKVPVRIGGSKHEPPQPFLLEKMMEEYFEHYQKQKRLMHPIILAAEMHERLVSIHPFIDGNGRTSRLVMNFILLKNGYTIANLKGDFDSRMQYYKALENVQVDSNPEYFYLLIIDKVEESLKEHIAML